MTIEKYTRKNAKIHKHFGGTSVPFQLGRQARVFADLCQSFGWSAYIAANVNNNATP